MNHPHLTRALSTAGMALLMAACSDAGPTDHAATRCGPGVAVDNGAICVYADALDPGDVSCPEDLPYAYSGDGWTLCSDRDDLDEDTLAAAVAAASAEPDDPTQPSEPTEPSDPTNPTDPTDPSCVDFDEDGVCAEVDQDDRDPSIGAPTPTDDPSCVDFDHDAVCAAVDVDDRDPSVGLPTDPVDPWPGDECVDHDGDGSCAGMDLDDDEPALRDVGLWTADDGRVYLVVCLFYDVTDPADLVAEDCQAIDICHIDPLLFASLPAEPAWVPVADEICVDRPDGYFESEAEVAGVTLTCGASEGDEMCFYALTPCYDGAGAITVCEAPCVDDDRDGICDG